MKNTRTICSNVPWDVLPGTDWFMSLTSGERVARYHWTELPMPREAIDRVSTIGRRQRMPATITYANRHGQEIEDDLDDFDIDDDDDDLSYSHEENSQDDGSVTSDSSDEDNDSDDDDPDDDGDHPQHGDVGQWFGDSGQLDEEDSHDPEGSRHDEGDHGSDDSHLIGPDETNQDREADGHEQDVSDHDVTMMQLTMIQTVDLSQSMQMLNMNLRVQRRVDVLLTS
jgi:hypothetical protein